MSLLRGVLTGSLGLVVLEIVVTNPSASGRIGTAATWASGIVRRIVSPAVAAIPNVKKPAAASTSAADSSYVPGGSAATPVTNYSTPPPAIQPVSNSGSTLRSA